MMNTTDYRPEIDGLRSIAVLAVIFYHLELPVGIIPLNGGFIGVDIFFVISGYLITKIIVKEQNSGDFKFTHFYIRRAKRILPVLLVVILFSFPFYWFILIPDAFEQYTNSILSSLFFGSNILFYMEDSYTSVASKFKPFLHTWSLSLEEQFYLFFPLILIFLNKCNKNYVIPILLFLCLFSLQLSVFNSVRSPDANFFLIHNRAWELLFGSLIALYELKNGRIYNNFTDLLPTFGLFLILHSLVFFNNNTIHPSLITLIPILGVSLLILFMRPGEIVCEILSSKFAVFIGLLSYSLYVWHYPIIVYLRIVNEGLNFELKLFALILTFLLSFLTYNTVEKYFRYKVTNKFLFLFLFLTTFVVILLALGSSLTNGFETRFDKIKSKDNSYIYSEDSRKLNAHMKSISFDKSYNYSNFDPDIWNSFSKNKFLIIGDSHLDSWVYSFSNNINADILALKYLGCRFSLRDNTVLNLTKESSDKFTSCNFTSNILNNTSVINSIDVMILSSHRPFSYASNLWRFDLIKHILAINPSIKFFILGNYFQTHPDNYCLNIMRNTMSNAFSCLQKSVFPPINFDIKDEPLFSELIDVDYYYVDIIDYVCDRRNLHACPYEVNGIPFMEDWNHLTPAFADYILKSILKKNPSIFD